MTPVNDYHSDGGGIVFKSISWRRISTFVCVGKMRGGMDVAALEMSSKASLVFLNGVSGIVL